MGEVARDALSRRVTEGASSGGSMELKDTLSTKIIAC